MERYSYRIKTEEEIKEEFPIELPLTDWISPDMDYIYGMKLELEWYEKYLVNERLNLNYSTYDVEYYAFFGKIGIPKLEYQYEDGYDVWWVRKDVIKEIDNYPNYNLSKKLVYEHKILKFNQYKL